MSESINRLKLFRRHLGYTQTEIAVIMDSSISMYKRYESKDADIPLGKLAYLSKKHRLNINWLVIGEGEMLLDVDPSKTNKGILDGLKAEIYDLERDNRRLNTELKAFKK